VLHYQQAACLTNTQLFEALPFASRQYSVCTSVAAPFSKPFAAQSLLLAALQSAPVHRSYPDMKLLPGVSSLYCGPSVQPKETIVMVATITNFAIRGGNSTITISIIIQTGITTADHL
jgi:hypothetical protein